jgi:hypothetical protein
MTFKHVKFEESVVMRSLEKLAKEKGLVKQDPITKSASKTVDLSPSTNLMENVLNLCAGLRQSGFHKEASEVEEKFVAFKQAQTLYETSTEKGEDVIDAAHSKGSHHLEGVDSDEAVVETILDNHLKSLKMIEKVPTGKLASSRDILHAVKVVLAQADPEATKQGKAAMVKALETLKKGMDAFLNTFYGKALEEFKPNLELAKKEIDEKLATLGSIPDNGTFPTQLMNELSNQFYQAKKWNDETRARYSGEVDSAWLRKFNYASSLVGMAVSTSWGAAKAINEGDLTGLKFHTSHVSADEVTNVININLVRPLQGLVQKIEEMDYAGRSSKLPADKKAKTDAVVNEVAPALKSAQDAVNNVANASDSSLRIINLAKISSLFTAPLDTIGGKPLFVVNSIDQLRQKCAVAVAAYSRDLDTIKSWLDVASKGT